LIRLSYADDLTTETLPKVRELVSHIVTFSFEIVQFDFVEE